jgi:hypothetical protein
MLARFAALALTALFVGCAAVAQPAPDPVTWESRTLGKITYDVEAGPYGVLKYETVFGDNIGLLFIDGLAGEFGGPGPLKGFWTESDVSHDDDDDNTLICPVTVNDDYGRTTRNWGRLIIAFTSDDFPTDFVLMRGRCFEDPTDVISGKLVKQLRR